MSCDSRITHAAWKQAMGYRIRLVTDFWPHGAIGRLYGAFDESLGVNTRSTFVLDEHGIVRETIVQPELGKARDVRRYADAVRALPRI